MVDALIAEYLGRLDAAAWPLPPSRRAELTAEVREHIEGALLEAGSRDETTVRNVLDRLGRPEDIVAAEVDATGGPGQRPAWSAASHTASGWMAQAATRGWGAIEIAAVLLLMVGPFVVWWVGPIVGVIVARYSDRWTQPEKRVATVTIVALGIVQVILLAVLFMGPFGGSSGFGLFGLIGLAAILSALLPLLAGIGVGVYLAVALQRKI